VLVRRSVQAETAKVITLQLLETLFAKHVSDQFRVRLWDGTVWPDEQVCKATLVLNHPGALRSMLLAGTETALGEAYLHNDFDIEGDMETVFRAAEDLQAVALNAAVKIKLFVNLRQLPASSQSSTLQRGPARLNGRLHSPERDQQAIAYHYNVSNDFYRLWLDDRLVYSCAYFHSPADDLNTAQANKLDYICRKLRLKPGQRVLDIGCGWGGLAMYAAEHYGVDVTGITLSEAQAELANERIRAAGLEDRVRILVQDYREVQGEGTYDALVSVGMFEHVGAAMLPRYFDQAYRLLRSGGVFLNHGISSGSERQERKKERKKERTFTQRYVFPDGELLPITTTQSTADRAGFEIRDVESLREHYAFTLRHWVHRLEQDRMKALQFVDETTYRVWRLFMSGSAYSFSRGNINVYQTLLVKPDRDGGSHLPLTRADWYLPKDVATEVTGGPQVRNQGSLKA
jgi:cyclopropane-fatty-acyl-phospholipid synthase